MFVVHTSLAAHGPVVLATCPTYSPVLPLLATAAEQAALCDGIRLEQLPDFASTQIEVKQYVEAGMAGFEMVQAPHAV